MMRTVVLEVRSLAETLADASRAMKTGRGEREARIAFATPETTCRRIIDAFADAVYPAREETVEFDGEALEVGARHSKNRLRVYIGKRSVSNSRRRRLRQTLTNFYDRLNAGVHSDVTIEEAQSLFLQAYLFLGEVLTLGELSRGDAVSAVAK